jgi:ADP-ribose pyrophosphatase
VPYYLVVNPDSVLVVPYFDNGDTMLVRQWRNAWDQSSWEAPAGTVADGEEPLACAHRELAEETGLRAGRMTSLGMARGAAIITGRAHLYLAEDLTEAERHPETYEQDMEVRRLPLRDALEAGLRGDIVHATSVAGLARAGRALGLLRSSGSA